MRDSDFILESNSWHPGELAVQQDAGVAEQMRHISRLVIGGHLSEQQKGFYSRLPMIVAASVDPQGSVWPTIIEGPPGFLSAPDNGHLTIRAPRYIHDPATAGLSQGSAVGLLGINRQFRRRHRLNGRIATSTPEALSVEVNQSYGNCSQYIGGGEPIFVREPGQLGTDTAHETSDLDGQACDLISRSGSFFIASYVDDASRRRQVDVSHKGGRSGFVVISSGGEITIPDYSGNNFFNTLGNITVNPRCGLLFVDYETGDVLQIAGDGELITDSLEILDYENAERLLHFRPRRVISRPDVLAHRFTSPDYHVVSAVACEGSRNGE